MKFDSKGYPNIKQAVLDKQDIQFEIDKNHTHLKVAITFLVTGLNTHPLKMI